MAGTTLVNIFGGPGIGKTTFASDLFGALKRRHASVETVREYAKDLILQGRSDLLSNQLVVLGGQLERLVGLDGRVSLVVCDSPLLLTSIYASLYAPGTHPQSFHDTVVWADGLMPSVNFVLDRAHRPYQAEGRIQDEEGAKAVDRLILDFLAKNGIAHTRLPAGADALPAAMAELERMGLAEPA